MIFVDTSFWFALQVADDANYAAARTLVERYGPESRHQSDHARARSDCLDVAASPRRTEYSFVDASSFALMRGLQITQAFAFDGDSATAGFVELR